MKHSTAFAFAGAALALGFLAGAWWMDARRAPEIAALEHALSAQLIGDLAARGAATPGPRPPVLAPIDAAAMPRAAPATAPEAAPVAMAPAAAAPPMPSTTRPAAATLDPRLEEMLGRLIALDADFDAQARNEQWAGEQERRIRRLFEGALASLAPQGVLAEVDCRTTMCRVRFDGMPWSGDVTQRNPQLQAIGELFASQRYGVQTSVRGERGAGVASFLFVVRPDIQRPLGDGR